MNKAARGENLVVRTVPLRAVSPVTPSPESGVQPPRVEYPGGRGDAEGAVSELELTSPAGRPDVVWSSQVELFVPWAVRRLGSVDVLDALPARSAAAAVSAALTDVAVAEGPIHIERLTRLVANSFGLNRVAESRRAAILRHLPRTLRRDPLEPVIWPPGVVPEDWVSFRRSPDSMERPIEHVPLREIVNAMAASARAAAGMSVIELHREALAIFGGRRLTAGITERLDAALELGVRARRIRVESDGTVVRC